jgi:hypothetical protein
VLGADSASTYSYASGPHHFNYGQKLFEIGEQEPEKGTLGLVTWGLGGLSLGSYRTLAARLSDDLRAHPPASVQAVAERWADQFWALYSVSLAAEITSCRALAVKRPYDAAQPPDPGMRTDQEELQFIEIRDGYVVGFCIAGYVLANRTPAAFEIVFAPLANKPVPQPLPAAQSLWGIPAMITRLIKGCGDEVRDALIASGKWTGTPQEFDAIVEQHRLEHPGTVPIREAIDFTHACLLTTVKAMKFSAQPRFCGGPIEIAVITTDRPFRWVQHKKWDAAIKETE